MKEPFKEREEVCQNLQECTALAEKYGLDTMTMDEISTEVKAVRAATAEIRLILSGKRTARNVKDFLNEL